MIARWSDAPASTKSMALSDVGSALPSQIITEDALVYISAMSLICELFSLLSFWLMHSVTIHEQRLQVKLMVDS